MIIRSLPLVVALLLAAPAVSQEKEKEKGKGDVQASVDVTILTLDVVATDKKGEPVFDLEPRDLEVRVAGKVQPLEFFEPPRRPAGVSPAVAAGSASALPTATPAPEAAPEPDRKPRLRVLFYVDLEGLPRSSMFDTLQLVRSYLDSAAGTARVSVVVYFGGAKSLVLDETSADRIARELDLLAETPVGPEGPEVRTGAESFAVAAGSVTSRVWETRRLQESDAIKWYLDTKANGREDRRPIDAFVYAERRRVVEEIQALRTTLERFQAGGDIRNFVFMSEGLEQIPGQNFLDMLLAADPLKGQPNLGRSANAVAAPAPVGTLPSPTRGFSTAQRVLDFDGLERWLASSGIRFHFVNPIRGGDLPTADRDAVQSVRNFSTDRLNLQQGASGFVSATGGTFRAHGEGVSMAQILAPLQATYRLGVRLQAGTGAGRVSVAVKRGGVTVSHQSAFLPAASKPANAAQQIGAVDRALVDARASAVAGRNDLPVAKPVAVTLRWKGKVRVDEKKAGRNLYRLEVSIPYDDLRFQPTADAFLAALRLAVKADGTRDTAGGDEFTSDETPMLSAGEMKAPSAPDFIRTVLLSLVPGAYRINAVATDLLDERVGASSLEVRAEK